MTSITLPRETRCQLAEQIRQLEAGTEVRLNNLASDTEVKFQAVGRNLRQVEADNAQEKIKVKGTEI